jgi:hypothetical protein
LDREPFQSRQHIQQLLGFTRIAQRQYHVAIVHDAQIAVERIDRIQNYTGRTGAGQSSGNFLTDITGFADADHDDLAAVAQRGYERFNGPAKIIIQLGPDRLEGGQFDIENLSCAGQMAARFSLTFRCRNLSFHLNSHSLSIRN